MSRFRRHLRPHLAGFLRIDASVMTTCLLALGLVLTLQSSPAPGTRALTADQPVPAETVIAPASLSADRLVVQRSAGVTLA